MRLEASLVLSLSLLIIPLLFYSNATNPPPREWWVQESYSSSFTLSGEGERVVNESILMLVHVNDTAYFDVRAMGCEVLGYRLRVVHASTGASYEYEGAGPAGLPTFTASMGGVYAAWVEVRVRASGGCSLTVKVSTGRGSKAGYARVYLLEAAVGGALLLVVGLYAARRYREVL